MFLVRFVCHLLSLPIESCCCETIERLIKLRLELSAFCPLVLMLVFRFPLAQMSLRHKMRPTIQKLWQSTRDAASKAGALDTDKICF